MTKWIIVLLELMVLLSCRTHSDPGCYDQLNKIEGEASLVVPVVVDTLVIDGASTSLAGEWLLQDTSLLFLDKAIVPIKRYSLTGQYLDRLFEHGRGPEEFISPALSFLRVNPDTYLFIDRNSNMILMDTAFKRKKEVNFLQEIAKNTDFNQLIKRPDPENPAMYELEIGRNEIVLFNGKIICPVTTEHRHYNGYFKKDRAKEFYQHSYTLLALDTATLAAEKLFGNYPPFYHHRIIPNYKDCHVTTHGNLLYVSYEADPKIYAYDKHLNLYGYFGEVVPGISSDFPSTGNLEDAETNYKKHRSETGYYSAVKSAGDYLFRSYRLPGEKAGVQIYRNGVLVGEWLPDFPRFELIGYVAPYHYALTNINLYDETFTLLKFKLEMQHEN